MTTPTSHGAPELLPCPFCGAVGVTVSETSTFRWVAAVCESCGAVGPEARRDTTKRWPNEAEDAAKAIKEWNNRAAIQQAAGAVREGTRIDLTQLYRRAEVHSSIAASPHHMTFTIEALRNLIEEFASPVPPKQQPDHLAGGGCGGVPQQPTEIEALRTHARAMDVARLQGRLEAFAMAFTECGRTARREGGSVGARDCSEIRTTIDILHLNTLKQMEKLK